MATFARAVGAVGDPREGSVDLVNCRERLRAQREVTLTIDGHRAAFARLFVELHVTGLPLLRERVGLGT